MSDKKFNIVFYGDLVKGADEQAVKENVAKLFNAGEKQLAVIFSGNRVVLKKNVDSDTAIRYRGKLKQSGIITKVEAFQNDHSESQKTPQPTASPAASSSITSTSSASANPDPARVTKGVLDEFNGETPTWDIAPTGVIMSEGVEKHQAPPPPDTSQITIAPAGSDLGAEKKEVEAVDVDISNISVLPLEQ